MDMCFADYARIFAAPIATIIAAIVAACFAFAQWKVAREQSQIAFDKLKLDLFEKRYAIYITAKELIRYVLRMQHGKLPSDYMTVLSSSYSTMSESLFFFDPEIQNLLNNVRTECEAAVQILEEMSDLGESDVGREALRARLKLKRANLRKFHSDLPKFFSQALAFERLTTFRF